MRAAAPELIRGAKGAQRASDLRRVFVDSVAGETIRALEATLRDLQGDPNDKGYADYRLTIDRWFGVVVDGDWAFAGFHAHESYFTAREKAWSDEPAAPWHVWLQREGDSWKLVTFRARPGPASS